MFRRSNSDAEILAALDKSQAVIAFKPDGTILSANRNFLSVVGYKLDEIVGRHHSIFVPTEDKNSDAYKQFWRELAAGTYKSAKFQRVAKDGSSIFIQATYNLIVDARGEVTKVVKFASDITE